MSVQNLKSMYPDFAWIEFFNGLLAGYEQVELSDKIVVRSPIYLDSFINSLSHPKTRNGKLSYVERGD